MLSNQSAKWDGTPNLRTRDALLCFLPRAFVCLRVQWQWIWSSGGTMISRGRWWNSLGEKPDPVVLVPLWSHLKHHAEKPASNSLISGMPSTWMHILYHILLKYVLNKLVQPVMLLTCVWEMSVKISTETWTALPEACHYCAESLQVKLHNHFLLYILKSIIHYHPLVQSWVVDNC